MEIIKKTLINASVKFTFIMALYMLILQIMNVSEDSAAVEAFRVLLIFLFSVLFAIASTIRTARSINPVLRNLLHYVIVLFAFYACFMLPVDMRASSMIAGAVLFTVVYLIFSGIRAIFSARLKANREHEIEYTSQFNKKK